LTRTTFLICVENEVRYESRLCLPRKLMQWTLIYIEMNINDNAILFSYALFNAYDVRNEENRLVNFLRSNCRKNL